MTAPSYAIRKSPSFCFDCFCSRFRSWDHLEYSCLELCRKRLACGHACTKRCHDAKCGCSSKCEDDSRCGFGSRGPTSSNISPQRPFNPSRPGSSSHNSSTSDAWNNYANGGVDQSDAEFGKEAGRNAFRLQRLHLDEENERKLFGNGKDKSADGGKTVRRKAANAGGGDRQVWVTTHSARVSEAEEESALSLLD